MQKMEESQNFVLKDCHEKTQNMLKRIVELEKTDFDDKFNHITRRMIGEVVREHLTPIQMNFNLEVKSIKKLVEEHAMTMEQFQDSIKAFKEELEDFRLRNIYNLQNNKKEGEAYMRELLRMQKLDHIRVQVSQKERSTALNNPWFNKAVDINQGSALNSIENESLTQDSLYVNREDMGSAATNNVRASLAKTPGQNIAMSMSSQFRSIQPEDINIRDSNLLGPSWQ